MMRTAAAARPAIAYEPAFELAAPVNVATGAAPVPVQDAYAPETVPVAEPVEDEPVPEDHAPHVPEPDPYAPVARVDEPEPAVQDEKLSIQEV